MMKTKNQTENDQIQIQERFSRNTTDSENFRTSQNQEWIIQKDETQSSLGYSVFQKMFLCQIEQPEITSNVHRGAINWLIKTCWIRNCKQDVLWSAIVFYYAYKSSILIQKNKLVMILATCFYISCKLHSSSQTQIMSIGRILEFGDSTWKAADIQAIQSQLLFLVDFQPYFQTSLSKLLKDDGNDLNQKILFVSETLMFINHEPVFNNLLLEQIREICQNPGITNNSKIKVLSVLKNKKQTDCLIKKYISKFDVQEFIENLMTETQSN